jgi:outer membrane protein assembly factor BamB
VIAYTNADTVSAPFILPKIEEYIAFYGTRNNKFEVYNLYSGIRLWNKSIDLNWYNNDRIGSPTISNDTVFFADTYSHVPNPLLHAYNLKTGQLYWTALIGVPLVIASRSNPVYDKGKLYLMTGNGIVCINSATGQTIWTTPVPDGQYGMTPVIDNNTVFAMSAQKELLAINASTGTVNWRKPIGYVNNKPLTVNGLIVINSGTKFIAYRQTTGEIVWEKNSPGGASTFWNLSLASGNTIVAFIEFSGFYGINASTGATTWSKPYDWLSSSDVNYTTGNGALYCYDAYSTPKKLFALNANTGSLLWENATVPGSAWELVYANKKLYALRGTTLTGTHGLVNIFDATTGLFKEVRTLRFSDDMSNYTVKLSDSVYYSPMHGNFK